ncbi:MAG: outer membrane beta-barrel protein [Gallionellaceae bacterium]|nr:outer membrane beta-barrel protein [Gallionellaceae bacterium]
MKKLIVAVLLSAVCVAPALAEDSPFYVGAQASDGYVGVLGGYQIDKMFSVEVNYYDFDSIATPFGSTDISSIGVAGVAMFPMSFDKVPPFAFFAKLGVERTSTKTPYWGRKVTDTNLTAGGGAQYSFNKNFSARVGVDVAGEADSLYIAGIFKF